MVLQLTLSPELEARLRQEAQRRGQPTESVALQLLDEHLPPPLNERRAAAIAMLQEWMAEDARAEDSEEAEEFFEGLDFDPPHHSSRVFPEVKDRGCPGRYPPVFQEGGDDVAHQNGLSARQCMIMHRTPLSIFLEI